MIFFTISSSAFYVVSLQTFSGEAEIVSNAFELTEAPVLSPNSKDFYLVTNDAALEIGVYQVEVRYFLDSGVEFK